MGRVENAVTIANDWTTGHDRFTCSRQIKASRRYKMAERQSRKLYAIWSSHQ